MSNFLEDAVGVDWDLAHSAKRELIQLIWNDPDNELWYLVELINRLQELAVAVGRWSFPEEVASIKKSELAGPEDHRDGDLCWDYDRAVGMEWRNGGWSDVPYSVWVARHGRSKDGRS